MKYYLIYQVADKISEKEGRKLEPVEVHEKEYTTVTYHFLSAESIETLVKFHLKYQVAKELRIGPHNTVTFCVPKNLP